MYSAERRARTLFHAGNRVVAVAASAGLLAVLGFGIGIVPALGRALVPGDGAWRSAALGALPVNQTLTLPGLPGAVHVSFSPEGVPAIDAPSDAGAFLALGYIEARFRLTQMDLERRVAEGRLAQLTGPSGVASDRFELRLGLLRTAQQEWAGMPKTSAAARILVAYSRGVNDYLAHLRATGQWPAEFSLAGVYPANWTPVDSLAVQGELAQELSFSTAPLDYAVLDRALGARRAAQWFPVTPPNSQQPFDPGPYLRLPLAPVDSVQAVSARRTAASAHRVVLTASRERAGTGGCGGGCVRSRQENGLGKPSARQAATGAGVTQAAMSVLSQVSALPAGQLGSGSASSAVAGGSAWAADGPRVASGGAMLAGSPQLPLTLPSAWYQASLAAPGLSVAGASVPGLPAILIGHNAHIAWSLTDTPSQTTLFYTEVTNPELPGEYFWDGEWQRMHELHYAIPVRGGATVRLTVAQTVHGPVLTQAGRTISVDWMGALRSPDVPALLAIAAASDFSQFRAALANWVSPALTFVYADDRGNIGAISPGYYPQVKSGDPELPLSGIGLQDVAGVIPYAAVPQVYDPRSHVIAAADQRPVGPGYPYYLGSTATVADAGFQASSEYGYLTSHLAMQPSSFAALQASTSDPLARQVVPRLLAALTQAAQQGVRLTPLQQQARQTLASWNDQMSATSAGASIWWTFWTDYLSDVFQPWWTAARVPAGLDSAELGSAELGSAGLGSAGLGSAGLGSAGIAAAPDSDSLAADLEQWTLTDQRNPVFTPPASGLLLSAGERPPGKPATWPGATPAAVVMRAAFLATVGQLSLQSATGPGDWQWGKMHTRQIPSLTTAALDSGRQPAAGDPWTVDAAAGGLNSEAGSSWRMIVEWSASGGGVAEGIYPGGQSEDPASPWYGDLLGDWQAGTYLAMPEATGAAVAAAPGAGAGHAAPAPAAAPESAKPISWELQP